MHRRTLLASLLAANVAALVLTAAAATRPTAEPGRIAFESDRFGEPDILTTTETGTPAVRVTPTAAADSAPSFAPDGRIYFAGLRHGVWRIFWIERGKREQQLTSAAGHHVDPEVSPTGRQIAFRLITRSRGAIGVVNRDGSRRRLLTSGADDGEPAWSPAEDYIYFDRTLAGQTDIFRVEVASRRLENVTRTPAVSELQPQVSPDGEQLVFTARDAGGNYDIYTSLVDGTDRKQVTRSAAVDSGAVWSPSGAKLAFTSFRTGNGEVYVANADGTGLVNVSRNKRALDHAPSWERRPARAFVGTIRAPTLVRGYFICDAYTPVPSAAADTMTGNGNVNRYCSLGGNDTIVTYGANDKLDGGRNNDVLKGGANDDRIYAQAGVAPDTDTLYGGTGTDTACRDAGVDLIPFGDIEYPRTC